MSAIIRPFWLCSLCYLLIFSIIALTSFVSAEKNVASNSLIPLTVTNYAALGDSYAAGIEAGSALNKTCWRYSDGYPGQLNRTDMVGSDHQFQYLACSGTVMKAAEAASPGSGTPKTIDEQIDSVKNASFATISIGGNDAGFFKILNACIYRFYSFRSGNCDTELENSRKYIESDDFKDTYNGVMDSLLKKSDSDSFRIFALGYSAFFDDALTDDCNYDTYNYWWDFLPQYLDVDVRRKVNDVCKQLNEKIGEIINDRKDDKVIWVNWAPRFDKHRFCQPKKHAEDGDNTWFFAADFDSVNIEGINTKTCERETEASGDWGQRAACGIAITREMYPDAKPRVGTIDAKSSNPLGPGTARVFHPKPQGYAAIVEEIRSVWPYKKSDTPPPKPDTHCQDSDSKSSGSVEVLKRHITEFCRLDFSINQERMYTDDGVKYTLRYKNPGHGWCNEINCNSTFKEAMNTCQDNSHNISKNGDSSIPCGKFSWNIEPAEAPESHPPPPPPCKESSRWTDSNVCKEHCPAPGKCECILAGYMIKTTSCACVCPD